MCHIIERLMKSTPSHLAPSGTYVLCSEPAILTSIYRTPSPTPARFVFAGVDAFKDVWSAEIDSGVDQALGKIVMNTQLYSLDRTVSWGDYWSNSIDEDCAWRTSIYT
jgi:hypothetical protein